MKVPSVTALQLSDNVELLVIGGLLFLLFQQKLDGL